MADLVIHVTDDSFKKDVVQSSIPVVLDFWAEWCGPCKAIAPILKDLAKDYDGRVKIAKLDVDSNPNTAAEFGIRGIPTLLVFKGGKEVDRIVGAAPKGTYQQLINKHL